MGLYQSMHKFVGTPESDKPRRFSLFTKWQTREPDEEVKAQ